MAITKTRKTDGTEKITKTGSDSKEAAKPEEKKTIPTGSGLDLSDEALDKLNENQLREHIKVLRGYAAKLERQIEHIAGGKDGSKRKAQVLAILQKGPASISEVAKELGVTNANVSSQLTYLRKDGVTIYTDDQGRKFIPNM